MPALPAAPRCVSLDTHFTIGDDTHVMSRLHFQFSGTPSAGDLNTMASTAASTWSAAGNLVTQHTPQVVVNQFVVTSLFDATMAQGLDTVTIAGTLSGGYNPAEISVVMAYPIARRYRGGHPRGYWPFGSPAQLATPQTWTTQFQTNLQGLFRSWVNAVTGATYSGGTCQQVNVSYYSGATWHQRPNGSWVRISNVRAAPVIDPVVAQNFRIRIGTQRRRMR